MKRNNATSLFAHMKRQHRDQNADIDHKPSSKKESDKISASGGKNPKEVPQGQKSITAFFQKPKRDREVVTEVVDIAECSTVLSEKRRKLDAEQENKDLPSSFTQWDKAWDEGTSGLEWNKAPKTAEEDQTMHSTRDGAAPASAHSETGAKAEHSAPERKRLLLQLDDVEDETPLPVTSASAGPGAEHSLQSESVIPKARTGAEHSLKPESVIPKAIVDSVRHGGAAERKISNFFGAFTAPVKQKAATSSAHEEHQVRKEADPTPEVSTKHTEGALPPHYKDAWDDTHVRLPCSPRNVSQASRTRRWDTIRHALWPTNKLESFGSLRSAILSYMSGASAVRRGDAGGRDAKWAFANLRLVLEEDMTPMERRTFFWSTLPNMVKLALALPTVCSEPIPLLRAGSARSVNLTALQCASLLANAFFCTFPAAAAREQSGRFPYINFMNLFEAEKGVDQTPKRHEKRHKLRCLLHYFDRQAARLDGDGDGQFGSKLRERVVTFSRRVLREEVDWARSEAKFDAVRLRVQTKGTIEDLDLSGHTWQADFANCIIGGGVLGKGAVQEEIRFLLSPELIVSRLLAEQMGPKESVLIVGSERFCNYSGYASSFRFAGDHTDEAELDLSGRLRTAVTAMDAIYFYRGEYLHQFRSESLRRELDKALVAFCPLRDRRLKAEAHDEGSDGSGRLGPVASGNWGCGVFGGDPFLKAVIQMMAAAESGRALVYLSFGDQKLSLQLEELFRVLVRSRRSVGEVYKLLLGFRADSDSKPPAGAGQQLRRFLLGKIEAEGGGDDREGTP